MKFSILCVFAMLLAVGSAINYNTQTDFATGTCRTPPEGHVRSPIEVAKTLCGSYGTFNLNLPNAALTPTFDATYGAYQAPYITGSLTYNETKYTTTRILFRHKSEHQLDSFPNGRSDAELQILMQDANSNQAVLSLFVWVSGTNQAYKQVQAQNNVLTTLTRSAWEFDLNTIGNKINTRANNDLQLNIFRYEGTQTFGACESAVWYLDASYYFVNDLDDIIAGLLLENQAGSVTLRSGENSRTIFSTTTGNGGGEGPLVIERLCFSGYFENVIGENYGLWFGLVIILIFFFLTLCVGDVPNKDPEYRETCKTIHPLYSFWMISNEIFTRKSRGALILMTVTTHALFTSVWYRRSYPKVKGSDIIVYAIYSMLISWAYVYLLGLILRSYYKAKYQYCKTKEESWDQKAQNRIFGFYTAVFATICIAWPFCVWNMGELHPEHDAKQSNYWVATFFVGLGLEYLAADIIIALLAKPSNFLRRFIRAKGYMYDNMCHETYMNYLKMD